MSAGFKVKRGQYEVWVKAPGGKRVRIGSFASAEAADRAYPDAVEELHGEFAFAARSERTDA